MACQEVNSGGNQFLASIWPATFIVRRPLVPNKHLVTLTGASVTIEGWLYEGKGKLMGLLMIDRRVLYVMTALISFVAGFQLHG